MASIEQTIGIMRNQIADLTTRQIPGNFTSGAILFGGSTGKVTQDSSNLFYDDTNNRLGVGTTIPSGVAHFNFTGGSKVGLLIQDNTASSDTLLKMIDPTGNISSNSYFIRTLTGSTDIFWVKGDGTSYFSNTMDLEGHANLAAVDTGTNTTATALQLFHRISSGTPAAGIGVDLHQYSDSTTTANRAMSTWRTVWATATDASRKARTQFFVYDNTTAREVLRLETSGTAAMIGFLGSAASAKLAVTGSRGGNAALASLLTQLATYGLITDSSSA